MNAIAHSTFRLWRRYAQNGADAFVGYADFFTCVQNSITFPRFCGGTHATLL